MRNIKLIDILIILIALGSFCFIVKSFFDQSSFKLQIDLENQERIERCNQLKKDVIKKEGKLPKMVLCPMGEFSAVRGDLDDRYRWSRQDPLYFGFLLILTILYFVNKRIIKHPILGNILIIVIFIVAIYSPFRHYNPIALKNIRIEDLRLIKDVTLCKLFNQTCSF